MKRCVLVLLLLLTALPAFAAGPLKVYVGEFTAVGTQAAADTKAVLQSLLASRLSSAKLLAVSSAAEAEVVVGGTYVSIGKQYNIDAYARAVNGQTVTRSFVQGEGGQEALFSAVGSLAEKLSDDLIKKAEAGAIPRLADVVASASTVVAQPVLKPAQGTDIVRHAAADSGDLLRVQQGDVIRPQSYYHGAPNTGEIRRLDGRLNLLTSAGVGADSKRRFFMAQDRTVQLFREGANAPDTSFTVGPDQKIIGIDYVDAEGVGTPKLFVTVLRNGDVASQIWALKSGRLVRVADDIPYFFRSISLMGGPLKLYAQQQGKGAEQFYGDVYQVSLNGTKIVTQQKIPMPRYGNIFGFNQFKLPNGQVMTVAYDTDNHLVVYDQKQQELWRSSDSFGNSELYYQVDDSDNYRVTGDKYRWYFINERIQVTAQQEVLVGKNDGFWALGNARMYKKGAVYCLYWNGAALEEVWRTKDTQNYMPDYYFDEARHELLLLQLTQREDVLMRTKGASALQIKKVE